MWSLLFCFFFFQAEDGIRDLVRSRGLGDVYKRQVYGSTSYDIDLSVSANGDMQCSQMQTLFLNTGYNGVVVWKVQEGGSTDWTTLGSSAFDGGKIVTQTVTEETVTFRMETSSGTVIATSTPVTFTAADKQTANHVHLIGTSGSEQLVYTRGCGVTGENCSSCSNCDDDNLPLWAIILICVAGVVVIVGIVALSYWFCCRSRKVETVTTNPVDNQPSVAIVMQHPSDSHTKQDVQPYHGS
eukprot:TRINITY_DN1699_c0_g1_i1.p1 TRINITY_DN1699_c0_g1~~TRINITY_DN1699_c0_g1_i1.p1  ORF type:complete len:241 (-),score=36.93 TRINITY_DN1699_c0_g1_i1:287-1009(-)